MVDQKNIMVDYKNWNARKKDKERGLIFAALKIMSCGCALPPLPSVGWSKNQKRFA
jgi:hypothetical protein